MVCHYCYARLNKRAQNCRKCSRTDLRIKKKINYLFSLSAIFVEFINPCLYIWLTTKSKCN